MWEKHGQRKLIYLSMIKSQDTRTIMIVYKEYHSGMFFTIIHIKTRDRNGLIIFPSLK